jgi:GT2 family glycosyltransferase
MNRPDILFPCLDSIREHTSVSHEVWVVAYLFSPENLEKLKAAYPYIHIVESTELRGFSENNNLTLRQIQSPYCFILNDDTLMSEPVIDRLLADLRSLPVNAAAISPCIRFADGRIQTCGRTRWTPLRYAKHYLHLVDEGKMGEGVSQTYTLNGACFLIKTEVFKKLGWFDERYFFTPEDIALGHALNDAGYTVWVNPEVSITHLAGGSVSAMEQAIKAARVRGSMIFYGEPLWLKCFVWCFEALRAMSYLVRPRTPRNAVMRQTARNVMTSVFSNLSPKELFIKFRP